MIKYNNTKTNSNPNTKIGLRLTWAFLQGLEEEKVFSLQESKSLKRVNRVSPK